MLVENIAQLNFCHAILYPYNEVEVIGLNSNKKWLNIIMEELKLYTNDVIYRVKLANGTQIGAYKN